MRADRRRSQLCGGSSPGAGGGLVAPRHVTAVVVAQGHHEDAHGDGPFMRDAMMVASKRNSLDNNTSTVDARTAKRDEELTIYGFQKDSTITKGTSSARSSVRSSFDDFFYGSRVPKAEKNAENKTNNINRRAASVDYPHPQWEHKVIRELHRKELARDHPEAKFRSEK